MRVVVTGGAGFIGSHVVDRLVAAGHDVAVIDDLSSGRRENVSGKATLHVADIRDRAAVDRVFADFAPEAVSHQAAQVSVVVSTREPIRDAEINVLGTLNVIQAAAKCGARRFVFASTGGAIYGNVAEGKATIDRTPHPMSPYACSKYAVENYLRWAQAELGIVPTLLRYANVYGPRQDPHGEAGVVAIFAQRVLAGEPVQVYARRDQGDDGCIRDYVFVDDVAEANVRALAGALTQPIANVSTGVPTTTRALLDDIESALGRRTARSFGPRRAGDVERSVLEPTLAAMGSVTPLSAGLPRTVQWFAAKRETK